MFNFYTLLALLLVSSLALGNAEPARLRSTRQRQQWARQQEVEDVEQPAEASPSPAPYPPAGVTPEIPFDLPTETEAATPDPTYGPPADEADATPDSTYGPPADAVAQNLIQPRNDARAASIKSAARSQPLLLRAATAGAVKSRAGVVEIVRAEPGVIYILK